MALIKGSKYITTKLTGSAGTELLSRKTRNQLLDWVVENTDDGRPPRRQEKKLLVDILSEEEFKDLTDNLKEEVDSFPEIVNFDVFCCVVDTKFEIDLVLEKSNLSKAKAIYRKLLKSKSQLDGLRGITVRSGMRYTLIVDVGENNGIGDGINRLVRLMYGIMKYRFNDNV